MNETCFNVSFHETGPEPALYPDDPGVMHRVREKTSMQLRSILDGTSGQGSFPTGPGKNYPSSPASLSSPECVHQEVSQATTIMLYYFLRPKMIYPDPVL
jgi:hypothetical protein